MLNLRNISKSVGGRILFEEASLTINYSDFVALVGPNGAGKSTLFNIVLSRIVRHRRGAERRMDHCRIFTTGG